MFRNMFGLCDDCKEPVLHNIGCLIEGKEFAMMDDPGHRALARRFYEFTVMMNDKRCNKNK